MKLKFYFSFMLAEDAKLKQNFSWATPPTHRFWCADG